MKKIIGMMFLMTVAFYSAQVVSAADIQKVTYFPLSYVAYHDIKATNMDIGTGRVPANGTLGSAAPLQVWTEDNVAGATTLSQNAVIRLNGSNSATTSINVTQNVTANIGDGNDTGSNQHKLEFGGDLRLGTTSSFSNLNTNHATVSSMNLFGKSFPDCTADRDEDGNNMYWVKLKLDATDKCLWYLSCGAVAEDKQCTQDGTSSEPEHNENEKRCNLWAKQNPPLSCFSGRVYDSTKSAIVTTQLMFDANCCKDATDYRWKRYNVGPDGPIGDPSCSVHIGNINGHFDFPETLDKNYISGCECNPYLPGGGKTSAYLRGRVISEATDLYAIYFCEYVE